LRRSGLGRGLGALIPAEGGGDEAGGEGVYRLVAVAAVRPNSRQPRTRLDEEDLAGLVASVRSVGVLQPVLVRPDRDGTFELIAGERRWRAAQLAGLESVPALVQTADDLSALEQAVVENLHRRDLGALEEAAAYQQLIGEFGLTHESVAARVGKSRAAVTNTLRLLQLPAGVQELLAQGAIEAGHARALLGTDDRAFQEALARRAAAEGLSVRAVEEAVRARLGGAKGRLRGRSPRIASTRPPAVLEVEESLSSRLDTRVRVELGARKGRVVIDFASVEDLARIYSVMTEGAGGQGRGT